MKIHKVDFDQIHSFKSIFKDYLKGVKQISPYYSYTPSIEGFKNAIQKRSFDTAKRMVLHQALIQQYQPISPKGLVLRHIESLKNENTFTVTTGHQLNIFTGPLYFVYKILSVIHTAQKLKEAFPQHHFVPVYWMASEDHDLQEINHFNLFGKTYTWNTSQRGAVGRMHLEGMKELADHIPDLPALFKNAYTTSKNLAEATRCIVHELFGEYGLIVLDGDDKNLKALFKNTIKAEIEHNHSYHSVTDTSQQFESLGYDVQAHSREINFFYLDKNIRERFVYEDKVFKVLNTDLHFSKADLLKLADASPEKFSPNVIIRPLYQECILPNLSYTGGPAEIAYWLLLKNLFDYYKTPFPLLLPRGFVCYLNHKNSDKLEKLGLSPENIFQETHDLKIAYLKAHSKIAFETDLEKKQLENIFTSLKQKATDIDTTLEAYVESEWQKSVKQIEHIEKKLRKALEQKENDSIKQIELLKEKLFPNNSLQERSVNLLEFFINDPNFINKIYQSIDSMDFRFTILMDHE